MENIKGIAHEVFTLLDRESRGKLSFDAVTYLANHSRLPLGDNEVLDIFLRHASASSGVYLTMDDNFVNLLVEMCETSATPIGRVWQVFADDQLKVLFTLCTDATGRNVVRQTMVQLFNALVRSGEEPSDEGFAAALYGANGVRGSATGTHSLNEYVPENVGVQDFFEHFRRGWPHLSKPYIISSLLKFVNEQGVPHGQDANGGDHGSGKPNAAIHTSGARLSHEFPKTMPLSEKMQSRVAESTPLASRYPSIAALSSKSTKPPSLLRMVGPDVSGGPRDCALSFVASPVQRMMHGGICGDPLEIQVEVLKTAVMELQSRLRGSEQLRDRLTQLESENFVLQETLDLAQEEYRGERAALVAAEEECDRLRASFAAQSSEVSVLRDRVNELSNTLEVAAFEVEHTKNLNKSQLSGGAKRDGSAANSDRTSSAINEELFGSLKMFLERKERDVERREETVSEEIRKLESKHESLRVWEELLQRKQEDLVIGEVEAKRKWAEVFHGDEVQLNEWKEQLELKELDIVQREAQVCHQKEMLDQREEQIEAISLPERQRRLEMLQKVEEELSKRERDLRQKERSYLDGLMNIELDAVRNENRVLLRTIADLRKTVGENVNDDVDASLKDTRGSDGMTNSRRAAPVSAGGLVAKHDFNGLVSSPTDSIRFQRVPYSQRQPSELVL